MSMRRGKAEGKRSLREMSEEEEEEEDDDIFEEEEALEKKQRGKGTSSTSHGVCQVESCSVDMSTAKRYHKRHRVCEVHAKAPLVQISGLHQRFCQQCSRFHELGEFDEAKRSCRRRLAGHNERRRKSTNDE